MVGESENLADVFVEEHWQSVEAYKEQCGNRKKQLDAVMLDEITNGASMMDHIYPYSEMPEASCDFVGNPVPREAKSRCCKAPIFRDGEYLICDRCRLVTKPIEPENS